MRARLSINLSVARSCFVRCNGCYNHFGRQADLANSDDIVAFLRHAYAQGIQKVTLCGGDPLARPDILDLLENIRALGLAINLDTVGTALLGSAATIFMGSVLASAIDARRLARLVDLIGIPVDGSSNEVVATFRTGRKNLFAEQLEVLSILDRERAVICVNTVVHRSNHDDVPRIARIVCQYPAIRKWQLFQFSPNGPLGYRNRDVFLITDEQFDETRLRVESACARERYDGVVEFKSNRDRHGNYLLVDSEGMAYMHDLASASPLRMIVGDIRCSQDHAQIVSLALEPARALAVIGARS
jgi:MoaA/NifB/PqqE/SkfB family radical SAM enzyme